MSQAKVFDDTVSRSSASAEIISLPAPKAKWTTETTLTNIQGLVNRIQEKVDNENSVYHHLAHYIMTSLEEMEIPERNKDKARDELFRFIFTLKQKKLVRKIYFFNPNIFMKCLALVIFFL